MKIIKYKKKNITKNFSNLEFSASQKGKEFQIKEHFQFNGHSVSAICYFPKEKIFYFIRQFRPNYFFNKNKAYPLEIVAGGIDKNENPKQAIVREIKEEIGVKALSIKKLCSLHIAPDCLDEITHLYIACVPKISNFHIFNKNQKESIEIVPIQYKKISKLLDENKYQNVVTRLAVLEILKLKI